MSRRLSHVFRVRDPERYAARHAMVWPEIERLLKDSGFTRYDIYIHGDLVISFMEVDDYEAAVQRYNESSDGQRWEEHWDSDLIAGDVEEGTGWPMPLQHVWSLDSAQPPARSSSSSIDS